MAKNDPIPDEYSLARWIKPRFLGKNDEGEVSTDEGGHPDFVFPQAFELRDDEEYLSVTCLNIFVGARDVQLVSTASAIQNSTKTKRLSKKSALVVGNSGNLRNDCQYHGHTVRVLQDPVEENIGHVAVRRYPRDVPELFELLAESCFNERHIFGNLLR